MLMPAGMPNPQRYYLAVGVKGRLRAGCRDPAPTIQVVTKLIEVEGHSGHSFTSYSRGHPRICWILEQTQDLLLDRAPSFRCCESPLTVWPGNSTGRSPIAFVHSDSTPSTTVSLRRTDGHAGWVRRYLCLLKSHTLHPLHQAFNPNRKP